MPLLPRRQDPDDRRGHGRGPAHGDRPRPRRLSRRALALWLILFAVYAATIGLRAFAASDYGGDEPRYLLTAKSIVDDHDIDLRNQYARRAFSGFYPYELGTNATLTKGRLDEPQGIGFPLLIAPAFALAGAKGVEVFLAALAALALTLAYRLALRAVPDPWAIGAALALGLSPPVVAYSTAVYPELAAAAALCGAALLALRLGDHRPTRREAFACFGLLAALPWLSPKYVLAALVIGVYAFRRLRRARRPTLAIAAAEVAGFSAALFVGLNEGLFGGPTPYAASLAGGPVTGAHFPLGYLDRAYRLVALFIDREYGLLRWAPVLALALYGGWLAFRERRSGLARAIPGLRGDEAASALCGVAALAQLAMAAFIAPTMFGSWFPGRQLIAVVPLCVPLLALGLRRRPRLGALLALIGVAGSLWLVLAVRLSDSAGLVVGRPRAPFGPLTDIFPLFEPGTTYPFALAGAIGAALLAALVYAERRRIALSLRLR